MDIKEIRSKIEEYQSLGIHLTATRIKEISPKLLAKCEKRSALSGMHRNIELHKIVYGYTKCHCGNDKKFRNFRDGFNAYCSSKCAGADPDVDAKRKATNIERHGVARPQQHLQDIRAKFLKTMQERYDVKYGGECAKLREKMHTTNLERFGTKHPQSLQEVLLKTRRTTLKRYGVEHIMQDRSRFEKQQLSGFKIRSTVIAGKTFHLRGNEVHAVQWLVDRGCTVEDIRHTAEEKVPTIWYVENGKCRAYHPDLYVKIRGKLYLVEVKSTFTMGILKHSPKAGGGKYSNLRKKAQACVDQGYRFLTLLIATNKRKPAYGALIQRVHEKTKKQVVQELGLLHPRQFRQL